MSNNSSQGEIPWALFFERSDFTKMQIQLNGEPYELPEATTLAGLLAARSVNPLYTAVEVNREIVSRAQHAALVLKPDDHVEVVTLVGGG